MFSTRRIPIYFLLLNFFCCTIGLIIALTVNVPRDSSSPSSTLRIAYSPEKEALFTKLVDGFNAENKTYRIGAVKVDPDDLVDAAVAGSFEAVSPDSAIWLDQIDRRWQAQNNTQAALTGSLVRYATSPIVIAAWERVAKDFGYPEKPVGWAAILDRALKDSTFRWSHPSSTTAMGLLAVTAEFYAGSGNPAKLTREDVERPATLDYVRRIERTVQLYGGETEDKLIERLLQPGGANLDAFVVQEQFIVLFNSRTKGDRLVAIYPADGTLWLDHPLALLESPKLTDEQRRAYRAFATYLGQPSTGQTILAEGYRPADLKIALDDKSSPLRLDAGVDPLKPSSSLPLPATAVLESIRESWTLLKRPANIYLVADVSGSMQGERITKAKEALLSFVEQIKDGRDRVGLISFSTAVRLAVPLDSLSVNRQDLDKTIRGLQANGNTALYDAIDYASGELSKRKETDRINVVLVMTDGEENGSRPGLVAGKGNPSRIIAAVRESARLNNTPVLIFTVAYGGEAELDVLRSISEATGGQAYRSDPDTIRKLYRILSASF